MRGWRGLGKGCRRSRGTMADCANGSLSKETGEVRTNRYRICGNLSIRANSVYIKNWQRRLNFEWDSEKARRNKAKHGVSFELVRLFDFDNASRTTTLTTASAAWSRSD